MAGNVRAIGGGWREVSGLPDIEAARSRLAETPGVTDVVRDYYRHALAPVGTISGVGDPGYGKYQQYLRASMGFDKAWRRSSGRGITVAVVDTGVDRNHEDLPRVRRGKDFVDGGRPNDLNGHGTFVAGVIGAERGNHRGIAGASRATILPVRVLGRNGFGRDSDISAGIRWAARHGADIINLSLGGKRTSALLRDAVKFAYRHGSLVVAASGNSGSARPLYPAAYDQAVAVGATDVADRVTFFSEYGDWLDVVAPGHRIASTYPGDRYAIGDGTSFAAPLVSGAAALALGKHPHWSSSRLRQALVRGAADAGPVGPDPFTGFGVLDVGGLVGGAARQAVASTGPTTGTTPSTARLLTHNSTVHGTPEGTATWFRLPVDKAKRVTVSANLNISQRGVLRGDVELALYNSHYRRLDLADDRNGGGTEHVTAVADHDVYVRVSNTSDTRWPGQVAMGFGTEPRRPVAVDGPNGSAPLLIGSDPAPESYGQPRGAPLTLTLSTEVASRSVSSRSVRLVDGLTGTAIDRKVKVIGNTLIVTPERRLRAGTDYALSLEGLRGPGSQRLAPLRVGFRTSR
jgi:hypothetical protein